MTSCEERGEEELEIFTAKTTMDIIEHKWTKYGYKLHHMGACAHFFYILSLTIYIYMVYLTGTYGDKPSAAFPFVMILGIFYPFMYDTI